MIVAMLDGSDVSLETMPVPFDGSRAGLAWAITCLEAGVTTDLPAPERHVPVLDITGTGGSGKSSLTDELVNRLRRDQEDKLRVAILAVDPTCRKGGGALSVTASG